MATGLALQAIALGWLALVSEPSVPYSELVGAFVLGGIGMALFFAPVANVVLSAVRPEEEGKASGVNNAIREVGGVFGVAVLASVFSSLRRLRVAAGVRGRPRARRSGSARRCWRSAPSSRSRSRASAAPRRREVGSARSRRPRRLLSR